MSNQKNFQKAKKRATEKFEFYSHLGIYLLVSIGLIIINISNSSEYLWFKWPLMGWGLAVAIHGLRVFVFNDKSSVLDKMIDKEMEKET